MTLSTTSTVTAPLAGNGSVRSFAFSFKTYDASAIKAYINDPLSVQTVLVKDVDYTVSLNSNQDTSPGGSITYPISALGAALASGYTMVIERQLPLVQTQTMPSGGRFPSVIVEQALDRTIMLLQQLYTLQGRSLLVPAGESAPAFPAADLRASKVLAFDANGDIVPIVGVDAGSAAALQLALLASNGSSIVNTSRNGGATRSVQSVLGEFDITPENFDNGARTDQQLIDLALAAIAAVGYGTLRLLRRYDITTSVVVPDYTTIIGSRKTGFRMLNSGFTNTSLSTTAAMYGTTATGLQCSGELSGSYVPRYGVRLEGFTIERESGGSEYSYLTPVVARNCVDFTCHRLEIKNFAAGKAITLDSMQGDWSVTENYVHDFYTNDTTWTLPAPQTTGVELDQNRVNSNTTYGGTIRGNKFYRLRFGAAAITAYQMQTDAINLANPNTRFVHVLDTEADECGEGIDIFASYCVVKGFTLRRMWITAIKVIHGASFNAIGHGTITDFGKDGLGVYGSAISGVGDTNRNCFSTIVITGGNYNGAWGDSACVRVDRNTASSDIFFTKNNSFSQLTLSLGSAGHYGIRDDSPSGTGNNIHEDIVIQTGGAVIKRIDITATPAAGGSKVRRLGETAYETSLV